jgi:glycosyltransferase involved in cell wall biosynthesis
MLNMLKCLRDNDIAVDLLFLRKNENSLYDLIPKDVGIKYADIPNKKNNFFQRLISGELTNLFLYRFLLKYKYNNMTPPKAFQLKYGQIFEDIEVKHIDTAYDFHKEYDCAISWEEGYCNYFLANNIKAKQKIGYIHPNYAEAGFYRPIDKKCFAKLDNIATVSKACYDTLLQVFPEYASKICYIPNPISKSDIRQRSLERVDDIIKNSFAILTVARIDDTSKAIFRLVEIARKLREDDIEFTWYIVGDGPDKAQLKELVRRYDLLESVILLGAKSNPYPYMKRADLFVLQSYYEGKPVVVDEAMIVGTPVLVTKYSSAEEQVRNNVTGYIVENNTKDIYKKLKEIMLNPKQLAEIRENLKNLEWDNSSTLEALEGLVL